MKKDIKDHARNDYIHVHVHVYVFALDNFPKIYHKMKYQCISVILIYVSYKYTV